MHAAAVVPTNLPNITLYALTDPAYVHESVTSPSPQPAGCTFGQHTQGRRQWHEVQRNMCRLVTRVCTFSQAAGRRQKALCFAPASNPKRSPHRPRRCLFALCSQSPQAPEPRSSSGSLERAAVPAAACRRRRSTRLVDTPTGHGVAAASRPPFAPAPAAAASPADRRAQQAGRLFEASV